MLGVKCRLQRLIALIDSQFCGVKSGKFLLVGTEKISLEILRKAVKVYRKCNSVADASNNYFRLSVSSYLKFLRNILNENYF